MAQMANLALDGGDPRLSVDEGKGPHGMSPMAYTLPQMRKLHDPSITFEEYHYYAEKTRAEEDAAVIGPSQGMLSVILPSKSDKGVNHVGEKRDSIVGEKFNPSSSDNRAGISDDEWTNANRALRTASWGAIFYLITTDILGPFALPYAFASMGWG